MKIDRDKIIKALLILGALFAIVGGLTKLRQHNSLSLAEYAARHPELTASSEAPGTDAGADGNSNKDDADGNKINADDNKNNNGKNNPADDSFENTAENLQNKEEDLPAPSLIGASLNGDSLKDLRITYADSFYYEPLSDNLKRYITGVSYPASNSSSATATSDTTESDSVYGVSDSLLSTEDLAISYDELRYVHILHYDFDGNPAEGELICNSAIAQDLVEIFYVLYFNEYQLEQVHLIDEYDGDDTASMEANNTSCFNYRLVEGSSSLSKHALGLAIDVNPFYNPYITYEKDGTERVSPAAALEYADRSAAFPYKIDENDLCYKLFKEHGFTWGGNWNSSKDYQHFQKVPK